MRSLYHKFKKNQKILYNLQKQGKNISTGRKKSIPLYFFLLHLTDNRLDAYPPLLPSSGRQVGCLGEVFLVTKVELSRMIVLVRITAPLS